MEKMKMPVQETHSEGNEAPMLHGREDIVLERLHLCTEGKIPCGPDEAATLHKDFETCESQPFYEAYLKDQVPRFDRMEEGIAQILTRIPENLKDDPEAQRMIKLLKGRALAIRGDVRSYVESIIRFVRLERLDPNIRDPKVFNEADHSRSRKHNNLLKTLSETLKLFEQAADYGLIERKDYTEWFPGNEQKMPEGPVPLFSQLAIANRDLIKNWALAADFAGHYQKLVDLLEQKK